MLLDPGCRRIPALAGSTGRPRTCCWTLGTAHWLPERRQSSTFVLLTHPEKLGLADGHGNVPPDPGAGGHAGAQLHQGGSQAVVDLRVVDAPPPAGSTCLPASHPAWPWALHICSQIVRCSPSLLLSSSSLSSPGSRRPSCC
ncbi:unnamed protein product [Prorocentrum cordatum]|uniref:Uncharacterized protein n=1 Tax=Prorocentrum cordatum TaxID=2364126 RepID=A0ABN9XG00_9DINO|nr:unnamed protein product [Polarella glacialis]